MLKRYEVSLEIYLTLELRIIIVCFSVAGE